MMKTLPLLLSCCLFFSTFVMAQNQAPVVDDIQMTIDADQSVISVDYGVMDAEGDAITLWLKVSEDGEYFYVPDNGLSGDVGENVSSGQNSLSWEYPESVDPRELEFQLSVWDDSEIDIQELVNRVDSNRMRTLLAAYQGIRHYQTNPSALESIKDSIQQRFENADLQLRRQDFQYNGTNGQNIIGKKSGLEDEAKIWIVDGHFDTVEDSPGADDNCSAVVGMLECLEILKDIECKNSIQFMGFDFEEQGLIGSRRYVDNDIRSYEEIMGVFNFEMIGYYSNEPGSQTLPLGFDVLFPEAAQAVADNDFRGDFITNVGSEASTELMNLFEDASSSYVPDLKVVSVQVPGTGSIAPDLRRSDHAPFWDEGYPALMLTNTANFRNSNYHQPEDTLESLNFTFMSQVAQATLGALLDAAEPVNGRTYTVESSVSYRHVHISENARLVVFPNPAESQIKLRIEKGGNHLYDIGIFSLNGQQVYNGKMLGKDERLIDLNAFLPGHYIVVANFFENTLSSELLIQK